ncbi:MAG: rod shape-determining protein RodA, partial [Bacteroidetes bacterium]|nr:rod shape-determining protein RodA [Bacteroidota bacterium]
MALAKENLINRIDWTLIIVYLLLVFMGLGNIFASEYGDIKQFTFDFRSNFEKQSLWIAFSLLVATSLIIIDSNFYPSIAFVLYAIMLLLLVAVLFFGQEISGSKSWFVMGPVKIQPAEFAKLATNLALAKFVGSRTFQFKLVKNKLIMLTLLMLPVGLILREGETGSALVYAAFILVLYREGLSHWVLIIIGLLSILFLLALTLNKFVLVASIFGLGLIAAYFFRKNRFNIVGTGLIVTVAISFVLLVDFGFNKVLKPYQQERINVLLGQESDVSGAAYNITQSKIAIGSGGLIGKGF